MKKCTKCHIEKNTSNFKPHGRSKDGLSNVCNQCKKAAKKGKVKYRKTRGLIHPTLPIKLTTEDGFGGKWKFRIDQLEKDNGFVYFARSSGLKNHMVNHRCWQVKTDDLVKLKTFCDYIGMDSKAIITFPKTDTTVYVVNLYHPNILEVLK